MYVDSVLGQLGRKGGNCRRKVDLVSLARPMVREPRLARKIRESEGEVVAACTSCNRCYASTATRGRT